MTRFSAKLPAMDTENWERMAGRPLGTDPHGDAEGEERAPAGALAERGRPLLPEEAWRPAPSGLGAARQGELSRTLLLSWEPRPRLPGDFWFTPWALASLQPSPAADPEVLSRSAQKGAAELAAQLGWQEDLDALSLLTGLLQGTPPRLRLPLQRSVARLAPLSPREFEDLLVLRDFWESHPELGRHAFRIFSEPQWSSDSFPWELVLGWLRRAGPGDTASIEEELLSRAADLELWGSEAGFSGLALSDLLEFCPGLDDHLAWLCQKPLYPPLAGESAAARAWGRRSGASREAGAR